MNTRNTWGAAVPEGDIDELQSSVVPDEHAPSRRVGGLGGNTVDERETVDGHAGDAVGNDKVSKTVVGRGSQKSDHSKG